MPNSISTHVSSLVGVVVSILAALHPGFTLSPTVTAIIVSIGSGGALLLQLAHITLKGTALKYLHEAQMFEQSLVATGTKVVSAVESTAKTTESVLKPVVTETPVVVPVVTTSTPALAVAFSPTPAHAEGSNNFPIA